jgi:hypothetical protein
MKINWANLGIVFIIAIVLGLLGDLALNITWFGYVTGFFIGWFADTLGLPFVEKTDLPKM